MPLNLCRHIRTNGLQCQGVALNTSPFCYFHDRLHKRHAGYRFNEATRGYLIPGRSIELGPLEDRDSIQVALSQVINALATNRLELKCATALLYGLQLASANAAGLKLADRPLDTVRDPCSTPDSNDCPSIDLAPPGEVYETGTIGETAALPAPGTPAQLPPPDPSQPQPESGDNEDKPEPAAEINPPSAP